MALLKCPGCGSGFTIGPEHQNITFNCTVCGRKLSADRMDRSRVTHKYRKVPQRNQPPAELADDYGGASYGQERLGYKRASGVSTAALVAILVFGLVITIIVIVVALHRVKLKQAEDAELELERAATSGSAVHLDAEELAEEKKKVRTAFDTFCRLFEAHDQTYMDYVSDPGWVGGLDGYIQFLSDARRDEFFEKYGKFSELIIQNPEVDIDVKGKKTNIFYKFPRTKDDTGTFYFVKEGGKWLLDARPTFRNWETRIKRFQTVAFQKNFLEFARLFESFDEAYRKYVIEEDLGWLDGLDDRIVYLSKEWRERAFKKYGKFSELVLKDPIIRISTADMKYSFPHHTGEAAYFYFQKDGDMWKLEARRSFATWEKVVKRLERFEED